ncbi:NAD kinase [Bacteroidia bacterium]|nr:NAD kinase [Bacteroidia bacterium]
MKIGIFGSNYQTGKQTSIKNLFDELKNRQAEIWVEEKFYDYLSKTFAFTPSVKGLINEDPFMLDMIFSLGGDGTFLRTAAWVGRQEIPVLGINMGRLGFLADNNTSELEEVVAEIVDGNYFLEEKNLLQLDCVLPFHGKYNYALNEIAVLKRDTSAMIAICASLNDVFLTEYLADGLIVSTPTGSTAYNLSVNGPIILPQCRNVVLSPVAPHSLNVRPLVIPDDYKISLKVEARSKNFLISLDGRSEVFPSGTELQIQKADFTIKVVKRQHHSFYDTLRKKLLWGTDIRENGK